MKIETKEQADTFLRSLQEFADAEKIDIDPRYIRLLRDFVDALHSENERLQALLDKERKDWADARMGADHCQPFVDKLALAVQEVEEVEVAVDTLYARLPHCPGWPGVEWPLPNVWLGVSVENQATAERLNYLRDTPAAVRFVSLEPMLEYVDLTPWLDMLDWVIIGGESGPGARLMCLDWLRRCKKDCDNASVPIFIKQLGASPYFADIGWRGESVTLLQEHPKGGDPSEWPPWARVQAWPEAAK